MLSSCDAVFDVEHFCESSGARAACDLNLPSLWTTPLAEHNNRPLGEQIRLRPGFDIVRIEISVRDAHVRQNRRFDVLAKSVAGRGRFLWPDDDERFALARAGNSLDQISVNAAAYPKREKVRVVEIFMNQL